MQGRGEKTVLINGLPTVIPENIPVYKIIERAGYNPDHHSLVLCKSDGSTYIYPKNAVPRLRENAVLEIQIDVHGGC